MTDGERPNLAERFTLITLTNGRASFAWRNVTAAWVHAHRRPYYELHGLSDVTQARSIAASWWLNNHDTDWSVWLDDDMVLPIEALDAFCQSALEHADRADLIATCYVPKRPNAGSVCVLFRDDETTLGRGGGLVPISGAGFGLVAIKREVFERIALSLPRVRYDQIDCLGWPFFMGMILESPGDPDGAKRHAGEDFAFCYRAAAAGCRLFCDTRLRIGHRGEYTYYWEDAGTEVERVDQVNLGRKYQTPTRYTPER